MRVVGLGAGGHARVLIDALLLCGQHDIIGVTDPEPTLWGTRILGVPVIGNDDMLPEIRAGGVEAAFIGVGSVGCSDLRARLFENAVRLGFHRVPVIHPKAIIAPSAIVGSGPMILAGAIVGAAAHLGDNVIINNGAIVEHDCMVGNHAHIATGATLAGSVSVGEGAHIGLAAAVREGVHIGARALVGAGAVVIRDVPDGETVAGVPARPIDTRRHGRK